MIDRSEDVLFTRDDLESYTAHKVLGLARRSQQQIRMISKFIWDELGGTLNRANLQKLAEFYLGRYHSNSSQHKCFVYTRNFLSWLYKYRLDQRLLQLLNTFEKPKVRTPKRLTTRIITMDDVNALIEHVKQDTSLIEAHRQNFMGQVLFLAYTGQRPLTMARIDREQVSHSLSQSPTGLDVNAEKDKIRLEHLVPIHPNLIPVLQNIMDNGYASRVFLDDSLRRYLQGANIPLSKADGRIQLKDLRKFFEQKSDEIGFTDANKNFIMSHGVSSVNWQSYKQFLPETVYKNYIERWGSVKLGYYQNQKSTI